MQFCLALNPCIVRAFAVLATVLVVAGCATTGKEDVAEFEPMPVADLSEPILEPIESRSITELLKDAQNALNAANAAHERGEPEEAMHHYTLMLELLLDSELDPTVFYSLRAEYNRILDTTTLHARAYERDPSLTWSEEATILAVRSDLEYPFPLPDRVLAEIREIVEKYPDAFSAGLSRSAKYLPYIRAEFEKAGLPDDLVWLAMVESMYTPKIKSRAGAGGMWQFMKSTGRHYGLRVDGTVDERYDWQKSTQAAIRYLSELHDMFDGSWPLAISAYNMGEAGLERAIAMNRGERNLWRLIETPPAANRIRRETKKFYPKLLATAIVAKDPERYGIKVTPLTYENTTRTVVDGTYLLTDLEKESNLPPGTLRRLNPQLLHEMTPPDKSYEIVVPEGQQEIVLAAVKKTPKLRPDTHRVRSGDTLSEISDMYGVSVRDLMRINNIRSARSLQINQRLVIPGRIRYAGTTVPVDGREVYRVRRGDSLSTIARRNGVRVRDLQRWNNLGTRTRIHIGDRLYVSERITMVADAGGGYGYHTVLRGEYPGKIARNHGMQLDDFLAINDLTRTSTIGVGDKLRVRLASAPRPARPAKTRSAAPQRHKAPGGTVRRVHVVSPGDNATTIAEEYGIRPAAFLKWNGLSRRSVLQIGDEYEVFVDRTVAMRLDQRQTARIAMAASGDRIVHRVRRGQNPTSIARRYHVDLRDLFEWNGWTKDPMLQVGNEVIVYTKR